MLLRSRNKYIHAIKMSADKAFKAGLLPNIMELSEREARGLWEEWATCIWSNSQEHYKPLHISDFAFLQTNGNYRESRLGDDFSKTVSQDQGDMLNSWLTGKLKLKYIPKLAGCTSISLVVTDPQVDTTRFRRQLKKQR